MPMLWQAVESIYLCQGGAAPVSACHPLSTDEGQSSHLGLHYEVSVGNCGYRCGKYHLVLLLLKQIAVRYYSKSIRYLQVVQQHLVENCSQPTLPVPKMAGSLSLFSSLLCLRSTAGRVTAVNLEVTTRKAR